MHSVHKFYSILHSIKANESVGFKSLNKLNCTEMNQLLFWLWVNSNESAPNLLQAVSCESDDHIVFITHDYYCCKTLIMCRDYYSQLIYRICRIIFSLLWWFVLLRLRAVCELLRVQSLVTNKTSRSFYREKCREKIEMIIDYLDKNVYCLREGWFPINKNWIYFKIKFLRLMLCLSVICWIIRCLLHHWTELNHY